MEYLVTAEQMRRYDENTSRHFGLDAVVLMERAALACLEAIRAHETNLKTRRVLIAAGCGNNGGDGFALGRLLMQEGCQVDFLLAGQEEKAGALTRKQMEMVRAYGGRIEKRIPEKEYDILVDALLGIGLSRKLEGPIREIVTWMNEQKGFVLSVDIPTGIQADSGQVLGEAVRADVTVTFGFRKLGTFLYPGADYAGQVICAPIGITPDSFLGQPPEAFTYTGQVAGLLPARPRDANKGTFGKVALLAGREGMEGAGLLCARGAFAAGCGMVKLAGSQRLAQVCLQALPEAMYTQDVQKACDWADVIGAGPGLSTTEKAASDLRYVLEETRQPLVLDADAINLLAQDRTLLERLGERQEKEPMCRKLVLTPHPGELARLSGCTVQEVTANPTGYAVKWAKRLHAVVLCKGARTVVASCSGPVYYNANGNSGMATAGSGDVITGILSALLAGPLPVFEAVCAGVYLHARAGDLAALRKGEYSMTAGDLADAIPAALTEGKEG